MSMVLKIKDPVNGTSLATWISYLQSQFENDTPVQIYTDLPTPITCTLDPKTVSAIPGVNNLYSESGDIDVTMYEGSSTGYALVDLPLTATVNGDGNATLSIKRAESYKMDRPNEREFDGYKDETIAVKSQQGNTQFSIENTPPDNMDLIGSLDDGAPYKLVATIKDSIGQTATTEIPFDVEWRHQAILPENPTDLAQVEIDYNYNVAYISPIAPVGAEEGDCVDIYRLSADRPELIYSGAKFGEKYVDLYPTIGFNGGHRIVFKTKNGDYITENSTKAWVDFDNSTDDILDIWGVLIDFGGNQIHLKYDINFSHDWKKDFTETQYLGGAVQGDWNPAVSRTGSISTTTIVEEDEDTIELLRRLADYPGHCHIRTPEGSSFTCDIQVKEQRDEKQINVLSKFSLSITRVDQNGYEMMPYDQWHVENQE